MNKPATPLQLAASRHYWRRAVVALLLAVTLLALWYSSASRAVIVSFAAAPGADPLPADLAVELKISGWSLRLGGNYLLLPGEYSATARAPGYQPLHHSFVVDQQPTQQQRLILLEQPGEVRIELVDRDGNRIVSSAQGSVLIDGERRAHSDTLQLMRGRYRLAIEQPRYRRSEIELQVAGRAAVETAAVTLEPAWSVRTLNSEPSGAAAVVDGAAVGTTPVAVELLESGSDVELRLPGFEPWRDTISALPGGPRSYTATLEPERAALALSSTPAGAAVTLDGHFLGSTPLTSRLKVGQPLQLSLHLEGYLPHQQTLQADSVEPLTLAVALSPALGSVELSLNVAATQLVIDDGPPIAIAGRRHRLELPARRHQLTISKPGYRRQHFTVEPIAQRRQQLSVELLSHEQAFWSTRPSQLSAANGSELRLIKPSGAFTMGSARREPGRRANEGDYRARLTRPYYIATTELTNAQFQQWRQHNAGTVGGQPLGLDQQPVVNISWYEAAEYCNWLSAKEGLPAFYQLSGGTLYGVDWDATGYRLPTEAEWAYAARSRADNSSATYSWSNQRYPPTTAVANYADQSATSLLPFTLRNYDDGYQVSAPVARFAANRFGLHDIDGNVSEWVNDYYSPRPNAGRGDGDSSGPEQGELFVVRGASWALAGRSELRLAYRRSGSAAAMDVGFRLARFVDRRGIHPTAVRDHE